MIGNLKTEKKDKMREIIISVAGERLDRSVDGMSRSQVQRLIKSGNITVNGAPSDTGYRVKVGDVIMVDEPEMRSIDAAPEDIPIDVVYEDEHLLVVNKEQGMVVHPGAGNWTGTLVNALLHHCAGSLSGIGGAERPGIVHRIDKDTSGLLVIAKTDLAHQSLSEQIGEKSVKREYVCVVNGQVPDRRGRVDAPIGRHPSARTKMAVVADGRNAVTHFEVLEYFDGATMLKCRLETGRTHQIRVHMAYMGYPVLGDPVYGSRQNPYRLAGQALHAQTLGFVHPATKEYMEFSAPLPGYFEGLLEQLRSE